MSNINAVYGSFIYLQTDADQKIINSNFTNIDNYEQDSVIFAGTELTNTTIENCIFENNTAISEGVIHIEQQSRLECLNWTFSNNFAVEGEVVLAANNGILVLINFMLQNNHAIPGVIANIYNSALVSSFVNCTIMDNTSVSKETVVDEMSNIFNFLWYFKDKFQLYLLNYG